MKLRIFLFLPLCLAGCGNSGSDSTKVSAQLIRLKSARASRLTNDRAGVDVNSNITIESLKVPIRSIGLKSSTASTAFNIYECTADTNDGCLVDLAVGSNLQNLLTTSTAPKILEGTFDTITVATCKDEGKYTGKIKATGKTDPGGTGTTLYTSSTSGALTTVVGSYGEATVNFTGCVRSYPLANPVVISSASGAIDVKLYFDIRDIAFFGDAVNVAGNQAWYAGGYSFVYPAAPTGTYVGVNYLDVAATVDAGSPALERYRITTLGGEVGTVGLLFTSDGTYIGGFTRSYFSAATTTGHNRFVTPIQTFAAASADPTRFTLKNYGSTATGDGYFNTTEFKRADIAAATNFTDNTGVVAGTYTSVKLTD